MLVIGGNSFGDEGVTAITNVLGMSKLRVLNLTECGITYSGARVLSAALLLSGNIWELDVWLNPITLEGARLILLSALKNSACKRIGMDDKYLNEKDVKKMMTDLENKNT